MHVLFTFVCFFLVGCFESSTQVEEPSTNEDTSERVPQHQIFLPCETIPLVEKVLLVPPGPDRVRTVPEDLRSVIKEGSRLMHEARLEKDRCGGSGLGWRKCLGDFLIAAVDANGQIVTFGLYEEEMSNHGFTVKCEREGGCGAGVNPSFHVKSPPGWTVVAIRTAVKPKEGTEEDADGAVYIPYSSRLNTPELRLEGMTYLQELALGAYHELHARRVKSDFLSDVLVTDIGTPDHIVALILTEQMFSDRKFEQGTDAERLAMLNRALTIIGANRDRAYWFTRSPVGASGPAQIMAGTYRRLRDRYPQAYLMEDVDLGRLEHHNAFKAALLHADAELWPMPEEYQQRLWHHPEEARIVLAAGYNASSKTVYEAIVACGDAWRETSCEQTKDQKKGRLPVETRRYLIKYEWIYSVLFDPVFRQQVYENVNHPR
ncbi:MAG: hypothetical protein UU08_C0018G0018 [Candidatus Uhrbacteria bacterium GW2011_GWE2_40_58]|nr:MAG: hypothetical protein UU08_C0018G0018 [Candidatus Uhrbacteria bacterium GW2011_GWE2_40_58]OGL94389.1 MAG: hypothetical protein A2239_00410 [Candidatus Uhrbacteria bacterium RIFOXYA2_FULL_40_9]OGL98155.1 MAG: hypothetical protein A2332_02985 [Candidatus Uhrbacteria bacterium RIFOXYB2_FULL_41_18]HBK34567.1 hypothetical protein [Candidatus Uhrbacteria bacterium]HCB55436.1 hypothetical protein [Candidatus Uhrbacteria bacterium]